MPPTTARNHLGDAQIDLHCQVDPFQALSDGIKAFDAYWDSWFHEMRRNLATANLHRRNAVRSVGLAQGALIAERDELVEAGPYPAGLAI